MASLGAFIGRLAMEPPFRLLTRMMVKYGGSSLRAKAMWDAVARPNYLVGLLAGADQARREGISKICAIEFGVAGGNGLLTLEKYAEKVENATGVKISVCGFDAGGGLPGLCGDYRDHPDQWMPSDYPMDEQALRSRLSSRTSLIIGNVADTVSDFVRTKQDAPLGFISFDLDLYSSTKDAFQVLLLPEKQMLRRVPLYFDDIDFFFNHRFAGEFLAMDELNAKSHSVKIDQWHGIANGRAFPENPWLKKMYIAHDLTAISAVNLQRTRGELSLI
jgi:hypothetical protein